MARFMRGFTMRVDDKENLALEIETLQLADLEEKTENFMPGGVDGELEIAGLGTKALNLLAKVKSENEYMAGTFGAPPGKRRAYTGIKYIVDEFDGSEHEHIVDVTGRLIKIEPNENKAGELAGYNYTIGSIINYTEYWDGKIMNRFVFKTGGWNVSNFEAVNETRRRMLFS